MLKSDFSKNIITLMSGATIGQLINVAAAPLLTRLYTPNEFGHLGILMSIVSIIGIQMSLKFDMSIVVVPKDEDAEKLFFISFILVIILGLLLTLGQFIFGNSILIQLFDFENKALLVYIPIGIILMGTYQIFYHWLIRRKRFKQLSLRIAFVGITTVSVQILFSTFNLNKDGLIIGYLSGLIFGIAYMFFDGKNDHSLFRFLKTTHKNDFKSLIRENIKFPTINLPQSFLNAASQHIPTILLAIFFSPIVVGFYVLGRKVFSIPMSVIQQAFTQVYFQKISEIKNNKGDLYPITKMIYKKLFIIGIVPCTILFFLAPLIFRIIFGIEWEMAGKYLSILMPWLFTLFIVSPSTTLLTVLNKQEIDLIYNIILFILRVLSIMIGAYVFNDVVIALVIYSLVGFLSNIFYSVMILKLSKRFTYEQE